MRKREEKSCTYSSFLLSFLEKEETIRELEEYIEYLDSLMYFQLSGYIQAQLDTLRL
jgi:hypothetical protein